MSIIKSYGNGWKELILNYKLWIILFLINIAFAMLIFLPLNNILTDHLGDSLLVSQTKSLFDYTLLNDFLNTYGQGISGIFSVSKWILLLYFLMSIFLVGGIIEILKFPNHKYDNHLLIAGGAKHFWKIFSLTVMFLIFQIVLLFLFFKIFELCLGSLSPFEIESDAFVSGYLKILLPIYMLLALLLSLVSDIAKIGLIHLENNNIFVLAKSAFQFLIKHVFSAPILYSLIFFTFLLGFFIHHYFQSIFQNGTGVYLFISILIGQLFILFRIGLKFVNLSSLNHFYKTNLDDKTHV